MSHYEDQWSEEQIKQIWEKGRIVPGYNPDLCRQDIAGAWIEYSSYGNTSSETGFGWEIDHRIPVSRGGKTEINNLRPLQWCNNRAKSDNYPRWSSVVSSNGDRNVRKTQNWEIS